MTYLTAGDPTPIRSAELLRAVADAGADVLEVGVPFSDPLADGPAIQRATERRTRPGHDPARHPRHRPPHACGRRRADRALHIREPDPAHGRAAIARDAADAGVDGVLVLDYPIEEAELRAPIMDAGLDPIFLVSPTTTDERIRQSAELGRGFLYLISRLGVTGVRDSFDNGVRAWREESERARPFRSPWGLVFPPEHVKHACSLADAAVVGGAPRAGRRGAWPERRCRAARG